MNRRTWTTRRKATATLSATALLALTMMMPESAARAEGMLIKFQNGVLCDKAGQVERIVSQHGKAPLKDVLGALNDRTGKVSCGMVRRPIMLFMEPLRLVTTDDKKFMIIKLTTLHGMVQYAWRPMQTPQEDGESV